MDSYKTIRAEITAEFVEKKSRFIALVAPVQNEADAAGVINAVRKKHRDANHNCFAYRLLDTSNFRHPAVELCSTRGFAVSQKYSDDGEPGGTAGMPIFGVLKANDLYNCIIVVTRYFGGIMLGAGGLVRAYSGAAGLAVRQAEIVLAQKLLTLNVCVGYDMAERLIRNLENKGFSAQNKIHAEHVGFDVMTAGGRAAELRVLITEVTNGKAVVKEIGYTWS